MFADLPSMIGFAAGALAALIISSRAALKGMQTAQEIVKRGQLAEGKVLHVWRPPIAGSFARVYFEFEPKGHGRAIQCCHVDRRMSGGRAASLPAAGASVAVRYLPENPARAVIAKLVSRFSH
jgi:hypothetical protein